ncbi:MAG: P-II family nitrogen regulator [Elusimicrobia bacterium]|nr:P-II family nitrogen regulator [Elusimicrobiota bacterium]
MGTAENLDLITIVIQHKDEAKVLDAILKAGAPGATYYYGRGTGVRQRLGFLGRLIEAEKIVILTAVPPEKTPAVVKAATEAARLEQPGQGFLCVQKASLIVGFF